MSLHCVFAAEDIAVFGLLLLRSLKGFLSDTFYRICLMRYAVMTAMNRKPHPNKPMNRKIRLGDTIVIEAAKQQVAESEHSQARTSAPFPCRKKIRARKTMDKGKNVVQATSSMVRLTETDA